MKIFKYEIPPPSGSSFESVVLMPKAAKILSVGTQGETVFVWALVDPEDRHVRRVFGVIPTGVEISPRAAGRSQYIDTVHINFGGKLVFHIFDFGECE